MRLLVGLLTGLLLLLLLHLQGLTVLTRHQLITDCRAILACAQVDYIWLQVAVLKLKRFLARMVN
jgi:hypothetical protein